MPHTLRAGLACAVLLLTACASVPPPQGTPRLVVLVVVDQARYDYLWRFGDLLDGGLARLLDEGVRFTRARHAHAVTVTAAGHASIATASHPSRHGIISNGWFDRDRGSGVYSVGDDRYGVSPRHLRADTLADWLQQRYRGAKVFAAAGKDRAAALLGGADPDGAFWWDRDGGGFTSSDYYDAPRPDWLEAFNDGARRPGVYVDQWQRSDELPEDLERYGVERLDSGAFRRDYPHILGGPGLTPDAEFFDAAYASPEVDRQLARFARTLIEREPLGTDRVPDLLALSFSALDTVGHQYGPNSPELLGTLLRLDRQLGELFNALAERVGEEHLVIALTSDHGVMGMPEYLRGKGQPARRLGMDEIACYRRAAGALETRFGDADWIRHSEYLNAYFDRELLAEQGIALQAIAEFLAGRLEDCPGVAAAYTRAQLNGSADKDDPFLEHYRRSFDPERSADVVTRLERFVSPWPDGGTTHGSPYAYDARVPMLFMGLGSATRIDDPVRTVDVAPSLAELLDVSVPEAVDGRSLLPMIRAAGQGAEP